MLLKHKQMDIWTKNKNYPERFKLTYGFDF